MEDINHISWLIHDKHMQDKRQEINEQMMAEYYGCSLLRWALIQRTIDFSDYISSSR